MPDPLTSNCAPDPDARVLPSLVGTRLSHPKAPPLFSCVNRLASAQYRYRLLQGAALSLAISECTLLWLAQMAGSQATGQVRFLASTVYYCFGLALVAGWIRLGGWFNGHTRVLFEQLATRRGFDGATCKRIETMAFWRWLGLLLAFPVVAVALVAMLRITRLSDLLAVISNLLLSLLFTQIVAACVVGAIAVMSRFEVPTARRVWFLACILPELAGPILPGFPTLRGLAHATEHVILRWGAGG